MIVKRLQDLEGTERDVSADDCFDPGTTTTLHGKRRKRDKGSAQEEAARKRRQAAELELLVLDEGRLGSAQPTGASCASPGLTVGGMLSEAGEWRGATPLQVKISAALLTECCAVQGRTSLRLAMRPDRDARRA